MKLPEWLTNDGRLRLKHVQMEQTNDRPPYLMECYSNIQHLEAEANRLAPLGYRVKSQSRDQRNLCYVTFEYDPAAAARHSRPPAHGS